MKTPYSFNPWKRDKMHQMRPFVKWSSPKPLLPQPRCSPQCLRRELRRTWSSNHWWSLIPPPPSCNCFNQARGGGSQFWAWAFITRLEKGWSASSTFSHAVFVKNTFPHADFAERICPSKLLISVKIGIAIISIFIIRKGVTKNVTFSIR